MLVLSLTLGKCLFTLALLAQEACRHQSPGQTSKDESSPHIKHVGGDIQRKQLKKRTLIIIYQRTDNTVDKPEKNPEQESGTYNIVGVRLVTLLIQSKESSGESKIQ